VARPTIYDDAVADSIMENMVERALTATEAIAAARVSRKTWYAWLLTNESLRKRWDACQENLADRLADECQHVAKSRKGDLGWARLYCDVLWRRIQKLHPRKYGTAGYIVDSQPATADASVAPSGTTMPIRASDSAKSCDTRSATSNGVIGTDAYLYRVISTVVDGMVVPQ